jgi:hypothetical protein
LISFVLEHRCWNELDGEDARKWCLESINEDSFSWALGDSKAGQIAQEAISSVYKAKKVLVERFEEEQMYSSNKSSFLNLNVLLNCDVPYAFTSTSINSKKNQNNSKQLIQFVSFLQISLFIRSYGCGLMRLQSVRESFHCVTH